jgi:hypothetical protein
MAIKTADIQAKAKALGIKVVKQGKRELIRSIQTAEGNAPCFQSDIAPVCGVLNCLWREDCVPK